MSNPIKMGIVGLGRAGWGMHVSELKGKEELFRIVAVCDIIPERNAMAAEQLGCRTYQTIDELIADEEIELVDIATRSCDHYEHACRALAAGKDVVLEKPSCTNLSDFEDLLTRANRPGKPRLFFRQNRRFEVGFEEMRRIIDSGVLGKVFELRFSQYGYQRRDDWQTLSKYGGGQMYNWGPHLLDHALQLLGAPVREVSADNIHAAAGGDCEDHFSIRMTGENGRYATVSVSGSVALQNGRIYSAFGTRGSAVMENDTIHLRHIDPDQALPPVVSDEKTPTNGFGSTGTFEMQINPVWIEKEIKPEGEDLRVFWVHLYETYRNGAEFPIKEEEVAALMRVIDAAKKYPIVHMAD